MNKTARSVDISALEYSVGRQATIITQRNDAEKGKRYGGTHTEENTTCHRYRINSKLRMLRGIWLQSAFLARDGVLK